MLDHPSDRFLAVQNALSADQRERVLKNFTEKNPHWRGAHVADILAALVDSDSYLEVTEPICEHVDAIAKKSFRDGETPISRWAMTSLRSLLVPSALALFLADGTRDVEPIMKFAERAYWLSLPSMYIVVKAALVERGWGIDSTATENASGELHEFVHPETGKRMAWLDAYFAEESREVTLGKPER